jgi:regulator of protease activity HflC (stomatin/prohibitin superfamily)
MNDGNESARVVLGGSAFLFTCFVIVLALWGCPKYNVYNQEMDGRAQLAHAQFSREVAVAEAKAKMEAAELLAQADISRAKGAAQANIILGDSLKGNSDYLRYLWIQNLEHAQAGTQVIYVPTEAGLPILEAGKRLP